MLDESDGNALILCDMIIDSQQYDYDGNYSNNYAESTVRAWLNDNFYSTAFNDLQKNIILTTEVDNSASSTGYSENEHACENTNDKVFLLSFTEVTSSDYGFNRSSSAYDTAREKKTTDYAQSQGAYTYFSSSSEYNGNGFWWLRSPNYYYSYYARGVYNGGVDYGDGVRSTGYGVVPALQIRL